MTTYTAPISSAPDGELAGFVSKGGAPIVVGTGLAGGTDRAWGQGAPATDGSRTIYSLLNINGDPEMTGIVAASGAGTDKNTIQFILCHNGLTGADEECYILVGNPYTGINGFLHYDADAGVPFAPIAGEFPNFAIFPFGEDVAFRVGKSGNTLRLKYWQGAEPGPWTVEKTDSADSALTLGYAGIRIGSESGDTSIGLKSLTITGTAAGGDPPPAATLQIDPPSVYLLPGESEQFFAAGFTGGDVNWSVVGGAGNGTISEDGVYTAPATPGVYTVRATGVADPSEVLDATVTAVSDDAIPEAPSERPVFQSATIESDGRTLTIETDIATIGGTVYLTRTGDRTKTRCRVPLLGGKGTTTRTGQIPIPVYNGQIYTYEYDPRNGDLRPVGAANNNDDLEPLSFSGRAVTNKSEITVPPVLEFGSGNDAYPSWLAVAPDDDEDLPATQPRAVGVAVSGAVVAVDRVGNEATHYITAGVPLRISPSRIKATGTTATGIVAYY